MRRLFAAFALLIAVAAGAGVALFVTQPPRVVDVEIAGTTSLLPGEQARLTATVRTEGASLLPAPRVSWSVSPSRLGSIDDGGVFTAGPVSGTATITASAGDHAATTAVAIRCPQSAQTGGIAFTVVCTATSDLYFESAFDPSARTAILDAIDGDVARVEADLAHRFSRRPLLYVFRTTTTFGLGVRTILSDGTHLPRTILEADGVFVPDRDVIGVNWQEAGKLTPLTTLRHELTHALVEDVVGPNATSALPAWFDEGLARLEEEATAGASWLVVRDRYFTASMAATKTLFSLDDLTDLDSWNSRAEPAAEYQYHAASQAVSFLRDDVGADGLAAIIDRVAAGASVAEAYREVSGRALAAFVDAYPDRVRGLATSYPGIATAPDSPRGPGLTVVLYGFTPGSAIDVTLTSGRDRGTSTATASPYGAALIVVGSEFPPGTYTITATGANGKVTVTARKTS